MSPSNSRLGYVYYPDEMHYTQSDLETWLPALNSLGARWLILHATPLRAIPEAFIIGLQKAGVEPVIHIPCRIGNLKPTDLSPLFNSYSRWGIRYVVLFDRPNMRRQWETSQWGRTGLVERFMDLCLPMLEAEMSAGLQPVLPPLEPGGDYWDTAFLEASLESIARRGKHDLLEKLTLSTYAWVYDKPFDWGKGGPSHWPDARPYHTPPGCQDQIGFRIFDWYAEIAARVANRSMPVLVVSGGAVPSENAQVLGPDTHGERNAGITRALSGGEVPDFVLNFAFYHLASSPDFHDHAASWYPSIDKPLPVVAAIQKLVDLASKIPEAGIRKPLSHYVLLPADPSAYPNQNWEAISPMILALKPVIGFSPREARMAKHVTIFADSEAIPLKVEEELRSAGCIVERFSADQASDATLDNDLKMPPTEAVSHAIA